MTGKFWIYLCHKLHTFDDNDMSEIDILMEIIKDTEKNVTLFKILVLIIATLFNMENKQSLNI